MYGPVRRSSPSQRRAWLRDARDEAARFRSGRLVCGEARRARFGVWVRALRLPFYPMTWLAYTAGAALFVPLPGLFFQPIYWWGIVALVCIEAATVFLNEVFDYETDRRNTDYGPFTGGSRVLVDGKLSRRELQNGAATALALSLLALGAILLHPIPAGPVLLAYGVAVFLGVGYTVPPLAFSHRGLGELVVAFTQSFLAVQVGALAAGEDLLQPDAARLALPLFFAVLPSITLSGVPDRGADEAAGKKTIAVRLGRSGALLTALGATVATMGITVWMGLTTPSPVPEPWRMTGPLAHGAILAWRLLAALRRPERRVDGLMALSLGYLLWYVVPSLLFSEEKG